MGLVATAALDGVVDVLLVVADGELDPEGV
jgi:hypothetical protein